MPTGTTGFFNRGALWGEGELPRNSSFIDATILICMVEGDFTGKKKTKNTPKVIKSDSGVYKPF